MSKINWFMVLFSVLMQLLLKCNGKNISKEILARLKKFLMRCYVKGKMHKSIENKNSVKLVE